MKAPNTIACTVIKKSVWNRGWHDKMNMKSVTLEVRGGRFYGSSDEDSPELHHGNISFSVSEGVEAFFDDFVVGQKVQMEIRPVAEWEKLEENS